MGTYNFRYRGSCAYGCFFDEENAKMYGEHLHNDLMLSSSVIYIASNKGKLFFTEDYKEKNRWTEIEKTIVYDAKNDSEYRLYDIVAGNVDLDRDLERGYLRDKRVVSLLCNLTNYFPDKPSCVVGTYNFRMKCNIAYGCFFDEKNAKVYGEHLHNDLMLSSSVIYIALDKGNLFFTEDYKEKNRWTEFEKTIVYDGETDSEYRLYNIVAGNVDLDRDLEDDEDEDEDDEFDRW